jgi:hypothetical protein
MKTNQLFLAGLMSSVTLLAACGGGGSDGSGTSATANSSTPGNSNPIGTSSQTGTDSQPATFKCPDGYKSIQITNSLVPNATMTLVTDDGIATLTFKTPSADITVRTGTICLGKPNPAPAGVKADYIYEITDSGAFSQMPDRRLTLNFTNNVIPNPNPPAVEMADVSGGTVTYKPTLPISILSTRPIYSLQVAANFAGLYVVRLTQ